jgi:hypothetical protein
VQISVSYICGIDVLSSGSLGGLDGRLAAVEALKLSLSHDMEWRGQVNSLEIDSRAFTRRSHISLLAADGSGRSTAGRDGPLTNYASAT